MNLRANEVAAFGKPKDTELAKIISLRLTVCLKVSLAFLCVTAHGLDSRVGNRFAIFIHDSSRDYRPGHHAEQQVLNIASRIESQDTAAPCRRAFAVKFRYVSDVLHLKAVVPWLDFLNCEMPRGVSLSRVARIWIVSLLQGDPGLLERFAGARLDDHSSDAAWLLARDLRWLSGRGFLA